MLYAILQVTVQSLNAIVENVYQRDGAVMVCVIVMTEVTKKAAMQKVWQWNTTTIDGQFANNNH